MRGWWQDLTDLVLPAECGGCGAPRTVLCPECRAALSGAAPSRVRPVPEPPGLPAVHAAAPYGDEVRAVLLAHKERGALALARPLGTALAAAVRAGLQEGDRAGGDGAWDAPAERGGAQRAAVGRHRERGGSTGSVRARAAEDGSGVASGDSSGGRRLQVVSSWGEGVPSAADRTTVRRGAAGVVAGGGEPRPGSGAGSCGEVPVLLVPVPSAARAVRSRGHDPVRRIALAAAGELRRAGMPARVAAVLRQRRAVVDQSGLNSGQRLANLEGALEVAAGGARVLAGGHVVLVDDLMTTGASLREAARAVREAVAHGTGTTVVYARAAWEGRGEQTRGSREENENLTYGRAGMAKVNGPVQSICAAVVAAPPDSFELNRNRP
ncbi:ComF family protein [Streptomyces brasiliensis]|nr:ComF family protein [Streptomyces brasiliensis]